MAEKSCSSCGKSKAPLQCALCHEALCKSCTQFLDEGQFSFLPKVPKDLTHQTYCGHCFAAKVAPALETYNRQVAAAKDIIVFEKKQGKETRLLKRLKDPVYVRECPDYDEAILRLAFLAMLADANAVIDVDLKSKKVHVGSYQTTVWSGSGMPATVRDDLLVKDRSIWDNPN